MRNPLLAPEIRELLQEGRRDDLRQLLEELHPNDAAAYLGALTPDEIGQALALLPSRLERDVFTYLDAEVQEDILLGAGRNRVKALLKALPSDERYEFLDRLDDRVKQSLVPLLEQAARADFLRREQYDDDQVGSILSTEYCALKPQMTVVEALAELRRQEPSRETIYYAYVVDDDGKLIGFVSLRDLITARDREKIGELMKAEPVKVAITADQEEAARLIRDYDLLALPVVDEGGRLVGILTYDDAADIEEEEGTEDIELMAGVTGEAEAHGYLAEPVLSQFRRRIPMIAFLALFNLSTATVLHHFEGHFEYAVLLALLPVVMATGGMVGGQGSSLIIRGLTVGDVGSNSIRAVVWKELRVCLGMAAVLSAIVFAEGLVLAQFDAEVPTLARTLTVSFAVALAMAAHVISAGLFGVTVPIAAKALGRDPATVSTPAVTAFADLTGASIFCLIVLSVLA